MLVSDEDFAAIIRRLTERTADGFLSWAPWEDESDEFESSSNRFTYYVSEQPGSTRLAPSYRLQVYGLGEDNSSQELAETTRNFKQPLHPELGALYAAAKASAYAASTLRQDVLSDLG